MLTWIFISSTWIFRAEYGEIHRFPYLDQSRSLKDWHQTMDTGSDFQSWNYCCCVHNIIFMFLISETAFYMQQITDVIHHFWFRNLSAGVTTHQHHWYQPYCPALETHSSISPDLTRKIHMEHMKIHVSKVRKLKN